MCCACSTVRCCTTRSSREAWIGLEYQAHAKKKREHSRSELEDATRLAEKITALGGEPTTDVAPIAFVADPDKALDGADRVRGGGARSPCSTTSEAASRPVGSIAAWKTNDKR
jgi:hypothetical protein